MTSIEWLEEKLIDNGVNFLLEEFEFIEQAKEMHKAEIIDAFWNGDNSDCTNEQNSKEFAEQYYQETFGSNGTDAKDVVLGYKTSLDAQMLDSQLPQTTSDKWKEYQDWLNEIPEISDEEIQKKAEEFEFTNGIYGFKQAIRWYREQLKQK
jgi:hypothetical protein